MSKIKREEVIYIRGRKYIPVIRQKLVPLNRGVGEHGKVKQTKAPLVDKGRKKRGMRGSRDG